MEEHQKEAMATFGSTEQQGTAGSTTEKGGVSAENMQQAGQKQQETQGQPAGGMAAGAAGSSGAQGPEDGPPRHHQWANYNLPPGYALDPVSGQLVFVGTAVPPQFVHLASNPAQGAQIPFPPPPPYVHVVNPTSPEQTAAWQAEAQRRQGQIIRSVEQFVEGDATLSDVVRTVYSNTADNEQLWKGVLVGAAAAVLLTSKPAREMLNKTFGSLFSNQNNKQQAQDSA